MNATIIYKLRPDNRFSSKQRSERIFFETASLKEAYIYHIDHVNVDSYVIDPSELSDKELHSIIEHIRYLNAIITIILYKPSSNVHSSLLKNPSIKIINSDSEISQCLSEINTIKRDSNRIQWPLQVEYWLSGHKKETRKKAKVLSLSSSGCFINTISSQKLQKGDPLVLLFTFNNFDFYSDGNIVRISDQSGEREGIAIEFKEVSKQTQKCIGEIIDEKILSQIMETIQ